MCFHTNVHAPKAVRRFCALGSKGMAEGDFAKGFLRIHDAVSGEVAFERQYHRDGMSIHYGAEAEMANDLSKHLHEGRPLPVTVTEALEAGLTAMKIDESRRLGEILDLTDTWRRFDELACRTQ